jgi:hypothetical protein
MTSSEASFNESKFLSDLKRIEAVQDLIELIRNSLLCNKSDVEDCSTHQSSLVESIDQEYHAVILGEFVVCEDFPERLMKIQMNVFLKQIASKVLTADSAYTLLLNSGGTFNLASILKNILLFCRLLPPENQKQVYRTFLHFAEKLS